jgi:hypothetical protein
MNVGQVVTVADSVRPRSYAGKVGSVAVVRRVTPLRRTVRTGERVTVSHTKKGDVERLTPVYEQIGVPAVYEIGVDFANPDEPGALGVAAWFRPTELVATGATSKRTRTEKS